MAHPRALLCAASFMLALPCVCGLVVKPDRAAKGFNEWDARGGLFDEKLLFQYADGMKTQLGPYGFEYCVLDGGWHGDYDQYGRLLFNKTKYPSAAASPRGMGLYSDKLHAMGLKFGLWTCRGVKAEIAKDPSVRVKGTDYRVGDIVDKHGAHCPWASDWLAVNASHPAAQAYYDSIVELFAEWNLDFVKWDCMDSTESRPEMLLASSSVARSPQPIRLSLSLGPLQSIDMGRWIQNSTVANSFRATTDFWGGHSASLSAADIVSVYAEQGMIGHNNSFPDLDMMPFGRIRVNKYPPAGHEWTDGSVSFMMSLYVITRGPLMFGGELPMTDNFTLGFMTNPLAYDIHANSTAGKEIYKDSRMRVWSATVRSSRAVAVLNANNSLPLKATIQLSALGVSWKQAKVTDVWARAPAKQVGRSFDVSLPKGAGLLLLVEEDAVMIV